MMTVPGASVLIFLTLIWGFFGSFGLPPLDLLCLPPLAFLGGPMLEAGWCSADSRLWPVVASTDGVAWIADLTSLASSCSKFLKSTWTG